MKAKTVARLKGKDLYDLAKAEWGRTIQATLDEIRKGNKEQKFFWAQYSKFFFHKLISSGGFENEEDRKSFNRKLNALLGNGIDYFWLSVLDAYYSHCDELAIEAKERAEKMTKAYIEKYKYQKKDFEKALKILQKLQKQGFIISMHHTIAEDPKDHKLLLIRTKPINLFIWRLVTLLKKSLKPAQCYRITQEFLDYYLNHEVDLATIKKVSQRNPFKKMFARIDRLKILP